MQTPVRAACDEGIYLSIHPSIYPSIYLSIHLSIHPSIYLSNYLSIYLSIYPLHTSQCVVDAGHRAVLQCVAAVDRTDAAVGETGQIVHVS